LPTVESRSVSKISLTDCLQKLGKNTIHPPSCVLYSKVNIWYVSFIEGIIFPYRMDCLYMLGYEFVNPKKQNKKEKKRKFEQKERKEKRKEKKEKNTTNKKANLTHFF